MSICTAWLRTHP